MKETVMLIILCVFFYSCKFKSTETTIYTSNRDSFNINYLENYESGEKGAAFSTNSGELDGEVVEYYKNGNVKYKGYYSQGKKNGKHISYSQEGKVIDERNYKDDFLLDSQGEHYSGEWHVLNDKKIVVIDENYENGKLNGFRKVFSEEGSPLLQEEYLNSVLINEALVFSDKGHKVQSALYSSKGELLKIIKYDDNGQILSETKY